MAELFQHHLAVSRQIKKGAALVLGLGYRGRTEIRPRLDAAIAGDLAGYISIITEAELWRGLRWKDVVAEWLGTWYAGWGREEDGRNSGPRSAG